MTVWNTLYVRNTLTVRFHIKLECSKMSMLVLLCYLCDHWASRVSPILDRQRKKTFSTWKVIDILNWEQQYYLKRYVYKSNESVDDK